MWNIISAPFKRVNILNEENYFNCIYSNQLAASISPIFAAPLTISLGIPQEHTFSENNEDGSKIETDGSSGYFLGIKFPIGFGLGIDSYKTKFKGDTSKIATIMYNNVISVSYSSDKPYNLIRFWQNKTWL